MTGAGASGGDEGERQTECRIQISLTMKIRDSNAKSKVKSNTCSIYGVRSGRKCSSASDGDNYLVRVTAQHTIDLDEEN